MSLPLHRQPLKSVYWTFQIVGLMLRLPFWAVLSAVPQTRQIQSWPFTRSFITRILRVLLPTLFKTATFPTPPINEAEGNYIWVESTPELIVGEIKEAAEVNGVEAVRARACIQCRAGDGRAADAPAKPDEKVIYYIHGGGYIMGKAGPKDSSGQLCDQWLKDAPDISRAFQIDYRLSQGKPLIPRNPFPAALMDALAGYNHLVNVLGFDPQNIIMAGDSAGAHLGVILTRYLILHSFPGLSVPASLVLISPVSDWGGSHVGSESWVRAEYTDCVQDFHLGYVTRALLGSLPEEYAKLNPWISFGSLDIKDTSGLFKGFPPTLIIGGGAECALDQSKTLRDRMQADLGEDKVTLVEVPNALHAFVTMSWHEPERSETIRMMADWTKSI